MVNRLADENPYCRVVDCFARALAQGEAIRPGKLKKPAAVRIAADASKALIFAPHPDDEIVIGGLPLRLLRELKLNVVVVAVTLGSRLERRAERWKELQDACGYIGFSPVTPAEKGLDGINLGARRENSGNWSASVKAIAHILAAQQPSIVFMPHANDWHKTHIGTHHLVLDAMRLQPDLACRVVETEFWGVMDTPNLMVESSATEVADLVAALSLHVGEVARNAYHLRLPALMMDNVRRGAELVGGEGGSAPRFTFATLYRLRYWAGGRLHESEDQRRVISSHDGLDTVFLGVIG
ncbi:MAG: PIG-L family deacetylase [Acetobacteraceae bacterium]|nr:PIG-L family deacetylase [Acetobacteraceae bacterium]